MRYDEFRSELVTRGLFDPFAAVCRRAGLRLSDVYGAGRTKGVVRARAECWRHMRGLGMSYPEIGSLWDRDHTTVIAALTRDDVAEVARPTEVSELKARIANLESRLAVLESRLTVVLRREPRDLAPDSVAG